ncbi:MAG TPA: lasso peptide biosynthesis protein [Pseudonocardiaceae bacterium]|jgi:hypothetical protein|nr:lasso peptide biosynthesis protein [Pseudonocardiaceae bacterium]
MIGELSWAALAGLRFVAASRDKGSMYRLNWDGAVVAVARAASRPLGALVRDLRLRGRVLGGFLDPLEDAIFLTVALRRLGVPASFHVGRELVPWVPPAGLFAWVQCGGDVVSTSLPVREQYVEVLRVAPTPQRGIDI